MIIGYLDINSKNIELDEQRKTITDYASCHKCAVDVFLSADHIDYILSSIQTKNHSVFVANAFALGTSLQEVKESLINLNEYEFTIHLIEENYQIVPGIQAKELINALDIVSKIRRSMLSVASRVGIDKRRSAGKMIGRPYGSRNQYSLAELGQTIEKKLKDGVAVIRIAKDLHLSPTTIYSYIKRHPDIEDNRKFKEAPNA